MKREKLPLALIRRYQAHRVASEGAALAFYLFFTFFPLCIFLSALLGVLALPNDAILEVLARFLPSDVVSLARRYLQHIELYSSLRLMAFGLLFSVFFPMRAANALLDAVRTAHGSGPEQNPVRALLGGLVYTLLLIAAIIATLLLISISSRAVLWLEANLGLPVIAGTLWNVLRFPVAAVLAFLALYMLYALGGGSIRDFRVFWPGALIALASWMIGSTVFSYALRIANHYSLFYGSLGTIIMLMVWLNFTSQMLILGAEVNAELSERRERKDTNDTHE